MVFPSLPVFHLDPPHWAQQQQDQQGGGGVIPNPPAQHSWVPPPSPPPPTVASATGGGGGGGSRPGPMADRARLAKMAQPEAALKCPRCESTNTKFCYYNNYSLSQPRHFCKTCRRYWTRGGALRNVPVGGGCRRKNKRTKGGNNRSKSPTKAITSSSASISNSASSFCPRSDHHQIRHFPSQFLFPTTTSRSYSVYDVVSGTTNSEGVDCQIGNNNNNTSEQWKLPCLQNLQQVPETFLTNLEAPIGLYQFERSENVEVEPSRAVLYSYGSGISPYHHQLATTVKMDENVLQNNVHFWDHSNTWNNNNIYSFASSSTTHL